MRKQIILTISLLLLLSLTTGAQRSNTAERTTSVNGSSGDERANLKSISILAAASTSPSARTQHSPHEA
jgi:hypothetical protein